MRIFLLDRSSSMGQPFSNSSADESPGRIRESQAETKWKAACHEVRMELKRVRQACPVCLIVFQSTAQVVYEAETFTAQSGQMAQVDAILAALYPENGTDIASALNAAHEYTVLHSVEAVSLTLITDGLSNPEDAGVAAEALSQWVGFADILLIDPTPDGTRVADKIASKFENSEVTKITSASELRKKINEASPIHQKRIEQIHAAFARADEDRRMTNAMTPQKEKLAFTVGYHGTPQADVWYQLFVYLHLHELADQVSGMLERRSREVGRILDHATTTRWALRGTWLTLTPRVEGVEFNPRAQEIAWYRDIQELMFDFRVQGHRTGNNPLMGSLEITVGTVPIGNVPLQFSSPGVDQERDTLTQSAVAQMYEAVFASYAREDKAIVDICREVYNGLGIHMYIDRDLAPGITWDPAILRWVDKADVFQLYWSKRAASSEYVEKEWRHALTLEGRKGDLFIRPVYWEEGLPSLPSSLAHKNFYHLELLSIRDEESNHSSEPSKTMATSPPDNQAREGHTDAEPNALSDIHRARVISATVVPLLPNTPRREVAQARTDVSHAIAFLEGTTGLRYYPVPTLLVDELAVKTVRSTQQTVDRPHTEELLFRIQDLRDIAQSLLLDFHSGHVPPMKDQERFTPVFDGYSAEASKRLREYAEWGVHRWTNELFIFPGQERTARLKLTDLPLREALSKYVLNCVVDALQPSWRQERDYLLAHDVREMNANLGFIAFLRVYFNLMNDLLMNGVGNASNELWDNHYSIGTSSWSRIATENRDLNITTEPVQRWDGEEVYLRGSFQAIATLLARCGEELCRALDHTIGVTNQMAQVLIETSVFGIFTRGSDAVDADLLDWAVRNHAPQQATLPGTSRVLCCLNALDNQSNRSEDVPISPMLRRALARCVQVHEHFHAVLETGLEDGVPAYGPLHDPVGWQNATPLNESLAAWMELHYARKHANQLGFHDASTLTDAIWAYIRSGSYPEWPYRGAEYIENTYQKKGIVSIQHLIRLLRDSPVTALKEFNTSWKI